MREQKEGMKSFALCVDGSKGTAADKRQNEGR